MVLVVNKMVSKRVELLAPAGDLEKLKVAVLYGADAVFIGGKKYSLRSRASNFTISDIMQATEFAHNHGSKVYITLNILAREDDLFGVEDYISQLVDAGIDGVICADFAIMQIVKDKFPNLELHISTQQSIANHMAIKTYERLGAKRVVLARELSLEQIESVKKKTNLELEVFIHGGMCMSFSGRCLLSNYMTGRDANKGGCAHSCRWNYQLTNNDVELQTKSNTPFSMSSKDLTAYSVLTKLLEIGVSSLKIEGRMKSLHYIATIVGAYRKIIDDYYNKGKIVPEQDAIKELKMAENRLTSTGFLESFPDEDDQLYNIRSEKPNKAFIGIVRGYDEIDKLCVVEQRNYFTLGDEVEIIGPKNFRLVTKVTKMLDDKKSEIEIARHPKQILSIDFGEYVPEYSFIRKIENN